MYPDKVLSELVDKAVQVIQTRAGREQPLFLYVPLTAPHTPVAPSKDFLGRSGTRDQYLDFVLEVDHSLGRIMAASKEAGGHDDTLVIFTSDNGPERFMHLRKKEIGHFSAAQYRGCKRDNWDGGHRVPLIAQWPTKISGGTRSAQIVSLVDIFATVSAIVGAYYPDGAGEDSFDILPAMLDVSRARPIRETTIHHSASGCFAIRKGGWKLLIHQGSGGNSYDEFEDMSPVQLYRISEDEHEDRNLCKEHREIVVELAEDFLRILGKGRSTPGQEQPNHGGVDRWDQVDSAIESLSQMGITISGS